MVNVVQSREGSFFGISYVRVTDTGVYNMLLGLNPDGTERVEREEILEPEDPKEPETQTTNQDITLDDIAEMDWADCVDDWVAPIQKKKTVTIRKLEPLLTLNSPRLGKFTVSRAIVKDLDDGQKHDVLVSRNVPKWITADDIKKRFAPFVSDSKTKYKKIYDGRVNYFTYPDVSIKNNTVYVHFNPSTRDAQFALLMRKKTEIKSKDGTVHTMIFNVAQNYTKKYHN